MVISGQAEAGSEVADGMTRKKPAPEIPLASAAAVLGRRGAQARAAKLSPEERHRIAKAAIEARWARWRAAGKPPIRRRKKSELPSHARGKEGS
jgi:hypothetical protein